MLKHRSAWTLLLAIGAVSLSTTRTEAAPDQVIQYQGRLVDVNGVPLEGTIGRLAFRVYSSDTPSSATFVWGEAHSLVAVNRGVFTVQLGAGTDTVDVNGHLTDGAHPFTTEFDGTPRFIEVQVNDDAPLTPLSRIGSVPQAISSHTTRTVFDPATSTALDLDALDTRYVEPAEVDGIVTQATTTVAGKVVLATDGETTAGEAVQASDSRLTGIQVRRNNGGVTTGRRPRINFVEGPNVTITTVEDGSADNEVDVTISAPNAQSGVVGLNHGSTGTSRSVVVPANTLTVDGQSLHIWATGASAGALVEGRFNGNLVTDPINSANSEGNNGQFILQVKVIRTGPTSAIVSSVLNFYGQDASSGSNFDVVVERYIPMSVNWATPLTALVQIPAPNPGNSLVNIVHVRAER